MVVVGMVDMVRMRWVCYYEYYQVGLVAVGAVKMKRKILPAGSEDWPKDLIQEKLLEAVTCPNICLQVAIFYFVQNKNCFSGRQPWRTWSACQGGSTR